MHLHMRKKGIESWSDAYRIMNENQLKNKFKMLN